VLNSKRPLALFAKKEAVKEASISMVPMAKLFDSKSPGIDFSDRLFIRNAVGPKPHKIVMTIKLVRIRL